MFTRLTIAAVLAVCQLFPVPQAVLAWESDWALDKTLGVVDAPVRRPIILPFGDGAQRGAPLPGGSLYMQQPAGAQRDFRNLASTSLPGLAGGVTTSEGSTADSVVVGGSPSTGPATIVANPGSGSSGSVSDQTDNTDQGMGNNGNTIDGAQIPLPDLSGDDLPIETPSIPFSANALH